MFRDRTNLYLSYRHTFPHKKPISTAYTDHQEKSGLLNNSNDSGDIELAEFSDNPISRTSNSQYTETVIEIERNGTQLTERIKENLKQLDRKYREIILPNFDDEFIHKEMKQIDDLSGHIMVEIQSLYKMINQLQQLDKTLLNLDVDRLNPFHDEQLDEEDISSTRSLINNLKRKFAIVAQELTGQFRDMQGRYVKYLKRDEIGDFKSNDVETYSRNAMLESSKQIQLKKQEQQEQQVQIQKQPYQQQQQQQQQQQLQIQETEISEDYLLLREREIYKISQSVVEISVIFRELENIVIDQGTILDNIVYNLDRTSEQVQGADKELKKAEGYQKQTNKCKLVFFLVLLILFLLMLFMVKPKRVDHYVHDSDKTTTIIPTQNSPTVAETAGPAPTIGNEISTPSPIEPVGAYPEESD